MSNNLPDELKEVIIECIKSIKTNKSDNEFVINTFIDTEDFVNYYKDNSNNMVLKSKDMLLESHIGTSSVAYWISNYCNKLLKEEKLKEKKTMSSEEKELLKIISANSLKYFFENNFNFKNDEFPWEEIIDAHFEDIFDNHCKVGCFEDIIFKTLFEKDKKQCQSFLDGLEKGRMELYRDDQGEIDSSYKETEFIKRAKAIIRLNKKKFEIQGKGGGSSVLMESSMNQEENIDKDKDLSELYHAVGKELIMMANKSLDGKGLQEELQKLSKKVQNCQIKSSRQQDNNEKYDCCSKTITNKLITISNNTQCKRRRTNKFNKSIQSVELRNDSIIKDKIGQKQANKSKKQLIDLINRNKDSKSFKQGRNTRINKTDQQYYLS